MTNLIKILSLSLAALFFTACASSSQNSSLIDKSLSLKQSPLDDSVYYYLDKNTNFKDYNKVLVPSITLKEEKDSVINSSVKKEISSYFTNELSKSLNGVVSNNTGMNSLKVEVSIEKIDVAYEDLKFYNFIPVALAVKAISRGTGIEDKDLVVAIAMRVSDAKTKKVLAMAIDSKKVKNVNEIKDITFDKVKPLLDEWIKRFELRLNEFSQGKYQKL